jgi:undecaprenyl pyrophosphate phosphatase UppP
MTVAVGLPVKLFFVDSMEQPQNVSYLWLVNGLAVGALYSVSAQGKKQLKDLRLQEFLVIGAIQGITALPGISRLGWTLGAALLFRLTWFEALKLSFLLSLPTIFFGNLYEFALKALPGWPIWMTENNAASDPMLGITLGRSDLWISPVYVLVLFISFCCGLWALHVLSKYQSRRLLIYFGLYCITSGIFFVYFLKLL